LKYPAINPIIEYTSALSPTKVPLKMSIIRPAANPLMVASSLPLFKPMNIIIINGISGIILYCEIEINQMKDF